MPSIYTSPRQSALRATDTANSFLTHDDQSILNHPKGLVDYAFKTIQHQSLTTRNRFQNLTSVDFAQDPAEGLFKQGMAKISLDVPKRARGKNMSQ